MNRRRAARRTAGPVVILVALLLVIPVAPPFVLLDASEAAVLALFALSVGLLLGYPGMVSLGHGAFLLLGAYAAALTSIHLTSQGWATLGVAAAAGAAGAALMAPIAVRSAGVFFLMLTLALGQLVHEIAVDWDTVTGGSNGLTGVAAPVLGLITVDTAARFYALTVTLLVIALTACARLLASPFGQVLRAIGASEERAAVVGYDVRAHKIAVFIGSGALAGLAGGLSAHLNGLVTPALGHWSSSARAIVAVIAGGAGSVFGPVVGAVVVFLLDRELAVHTDLAGVLTGAVFVLFVLAAPGGLVGIAHRLRTRTSR